MKKALIVAHMSNFIPSFEQNDIRILQGMGYCVTAAFNTTGYETHRFKMKVSDVEILHIDFQRSPYSLKNTTAYRQLKKLMDENHFDLIHCHTPVGGILTRLAARSSRKRGTKILYTAHGFHFFKGAPLRNWMLYYPCEWICAHFTDALITLNHEDYALASKKMKAVAVHYVPGVGIDAAHLKELSVDRDSLRADLGLQSGQMMLFSVGELNKNKNHQIIVRAMADIHDTRVHYFIAGTGDQEQALRDLSVMLGIESHVHLLGFHKDVFQLCKAADVFCFPSIREGLSVALLEAMAAGLPIVASRIRGNTDCIQEAVNGLLCGPTEAEQFRDALQILINDADMRAELGFKSEQLVCNFSLETVEKKMKAIYLDIDLKSQEYSLGE